MDNGIVEQPDEDPPIRRRTFSVPDLRQNQTDGKLSGAGEKRNHGHRGNKKCCVLRHLGSRQFSAKRTSAESCVKALRTNQRMNFNLFFLVGATSLPLLAPPPQMVRVQHFGLEVIFTRQMYYSKKYIKVKCSIRRYCESEQMRDEYRGTGV